MVILNTLKVTFPEPIQQSQIILNETAIFQIGRKSRGEVHSILLLLKEISDMTADDKLMTRWGQENL